MCEQCKKKFADKSLLEFHLKQTKKCRPPSSASSSSKRSKPQIANFLCSTCGAEFELKRSFTRHKKFFCKSMCPRQCFTSKGKSTIINPSINYIEVGDWTSDCQLRGVRSDLVTTLYDIICYGL